MTLLSIPSPSAFFPITWKSYSVPGVSLLIVTVVLPDGVTGIVSHSDVPDSLYLDQASRTSPPLNFKAVSKSAGQILLGLANTRQILHA